MAYFRKLSILAILIFSISLQAEESEIEVEMEPIVESTLDAEVPEVQIEKVAEAAPPDAPKVEETPAPKVEVVTPPPPPPPPPPPKISAPPKNTGTLFINARPDCPCTVAPCNTCAPATAPECPCAAPACAPAPQPQCAAPACDKAACAPSCASCNTSCGGCDWCGGWEIYADYLYWRTRRCDLDFAVPDQGGTIGGPFIGDVIAVIPHFSSGYRIGIVKEFYGLYFDGSYTHYHSKSTTTADNPTVTLAGTRVVSNLVGVSQGQIRFAQGQWKINYDEGDFLLGIDFDMSSCLETSVFGGFKMARINQTMISLYAEDATPTSDAARATQLNTVNGYGADIGIGVDYSFWSCLNLFGYFSYDVYLASVKREFDYDIRLGGTFPFLARANLKYKSWKMASVINFAVGLGTHFSFNNCFCSDLGLSVGYEFHSWLNLPDFLDFRADANQITFTRHLQSLGFDGLVVRLSAGF